MRYLITICFAISVSAATCQVANLDHLMSRRVLRHEDIAYNCMVLIPDYYYKAKDDSIRSVLDYWESKSGLREEIIRTRILLSIQDGSFSEGSVTDSFFNNMLRYKTQRERGKGRGSFVFYDHWYGYPELDAASEDYDKFTRTLAEELKAGKRTESTEYQVCDFYSDNFQAVLIRLQNSELEGTALQQRYNDFVKEQHETPSFNSAFIAEYWMPTQQARLLGNHPGLGFQLGPKYRLFQVDATVLFRFVNAENTYSVFADDSLYTTDHYTATYLGLDIGRTLLRTTHSEISLLGGIAYDGITAVEGDEDSDKESVSVNSLNLNAGLGYRFYYVPYKNYIGIQGRFNVLDYNTKGGTDLSGNAFTIRLIWGFNRNYTRDRNLEALNPYSPLPVNIK